MKLLIKGISILFVVFMLVACSNDANVTDEQEGKTEIETNNQTKKVIKIGNPTVEDVLGNNQDADIFYLDGIVFKNAKDLEWVNDLEKIVGEEVAEIQKQTTVISEFQDATATKLPVGTKIFKLENYPGPVYIVVLDGDEIPYLGLIEG